MGKEKNDTATNAVFVGTTKGGRIITSLFSLFSSDLKISQFA